MGELLAGIPIGDWSAPALLGIFCLLILTGGIPTRRELKDTQARAEKWETAATEWQVVATKLGMSVERLLVLAETSNHALVEIQAVLTRPAVAEEKTP